MLRDLTGSVVVCPQQQSLQVQQVWCLILSCSLSGGSSCRRSSRERLCSSVLSHRVKEGRWFQVWGAALSLSTELTAISLLSWKPFKASSFTSGFSKNSRTWFRKRFIPTLLFQPHLSTPSPHILSLSLPNSLPLSSLQLKLPLSGPSELRYSFRTSQPKSHVLCSVRGSVPMSTPLLKLSLPWYDTHVCTRPALHLSTSSPEPRGQVCILFSIDSSASRPMFGIHQANKKNLFRKYVWFEKIKSIKIIF